MVNWPLLAVRARPVNSGVSPLTEGSIAININNRMAEQSYLSTNLERFSGLAEIYDAHRPDPPAILPDILTQLAGTHRLQLVVDLGSGTGLSTFVWAERAEKVIGIEPNPGMRSLAEARQRRSAGADRVSFQDGLSTQTGLSDGCADVVTCAQALHWMEPGQTFAEVSRILRHGGVFAAYDYLWPPTMQWEAEVALTTFLDRVASLEEEHGRASDLRRWSKGEHLSRMQASGRFRYVKELWVHQAAMGNAERLIGLALSSGAVGALLRKGLSESDLGLDDLRAVAAEVLGEALKPWYFSYHVRIGIK